MKIPSSTEHEFVGTLQDRLRERGHDPGERNAVFDEQTKKALADFQLEHGLQATGTVDDDTLAELDVEVDKETDLPEPEPERQYFTALLASNPNYFGTAPEMDFAAVEDLSTQSYYEELKCVGYEPTAERLEAVVHVKQSYGYSGDICTSGSPEYVRFYVDWENNGNWDDVGMTQFTAYDIPGEKPLEYGVSLKLDPEEEFCFEENLPNVRAILSWNQPPPPNSPNFTPVWGNVHESRIQIDARRFLFVGDLIDTYGLDAPQSILDSIDVTQSLSLQPQSLDLADLAEQYRGTSVQPKRFGYSQLTKSLNSPQLADDIDTGTLFEPLLDLGIDFDPEELVSDLIEQQANTYYEELDCVGLTHDGLNAALSVKQSNGFSGDLCSAGSEEYVAFWEWDSTAGQWSHLGTTSVTVHDITNLPSDGLRYAAHLPDPLSHHRQPCKDGPSTVRIRATLSWETPPPPGDPYWIPTWGDTMETTVHVPPGPSVEGTGGYLETVGKLKPCKIDKGTGKANGTSNLEGFTASDSPFGGTVKVTGFLADPPDILDGETPMKYRVLVRPLDTGTGSPGSWRPVRETFDITVSEMVGSGPYVQYDIEQEPDEDGYYTYREDLPHGGDWRRVAESLLVKWNTRGKEGKWELKLEFKAPGEDPVIATGPTCADGSSRNTVVLLLDNTGPEASIDITDVTPAGGSKQPANNCGKITVGSNGEQAFPAVGDTIHGTFDATDEHFYRCTLDVRPAHEAHGATINPSSRHYSAHPTGLTNADWQLDTGGMESCGYIARIRVKDRTIVNSDHIGWRAGDSAGFCLEESKETDGGTLVEATAPFVMERGFEDPAGAEPPVAVADHQFDTPGDDHENLGAEYVTFENRRDDSLDLTNWRVEDAAGHVFEFPEGFTLESGATVTLVTGVGEDTDTELYWNEEQAVWNNTGDTVFVYDDTAELVMTESY